MVGTLSIVYKTDNNAYKNTNQDDIECRTWCNDF